MALAGVLATLLAATCMVVLLSGCTGQVDRNIVATRESFHAVVDGYLAGPDQLMETMLAKLSADVARLEGEAVKARQAAFLDRHTDGDGGVVSKTPDGRIVPMPRAQLEQFIADANAQAAAAEQAAQNAARVLAEFKASRERLRALAAKLSAKEIQWQEAKESAQAEMDRILQAIGTIAAGAGAAAAVAP